MKPSHSINLFVLFVILHACGSDSGAAIAKEPVKSGEELYAKHCVLCHGTDGKKGFAGAGDLTLSAMSHEDVLRIIKEGKRENPGKIMTPFGEMLNKAEIEAVAQYVESIRE
ncbi:MAG: cytochrome c [Bacteroidota bacterium]